MILLILVNYSLISPTVTEPKQTKQFIHIQAQSVHGSRTLAQRTHSLYVAPINRRFCHLVKPSQKVEYNKRWWLYTP